jgi:hypothetical protein
LAWITSCASCWMMMLALIWSFDVNNQDDAETDHRRCLRWRRSWRNPNQIRIG